MTSRSTLSKEERITDNNKAPLVGIIGNIDRWKGQLVVLQAIMRVRESFPDIKCLIVGPVCKGAEKYKTELDEFMVRNNLGKNIVFTGYRNDISDILQSIDVLIHASVSPEPFGRVILEGMAYAKPIVATNSGGTPEQIIDVETGMLVPMNDPKSMADAVLFYLDDMERAKAIGERGRQRLLEMFSIKRMVEETEKVYQEIFNS
jgi:glycosyltransferase involved in cell wall biosynthesis